MASSRENLGFVMVEWKIGDKRITKCPSCEEIVLCEYAPSEYASQVHGDETPVWECPECRVRNADDI